MRWMLRLVEAGDDARSRNADLMEICRPEGLREIADLGSSLPEAKQLFTSLQRAVVASRADQDGRLRPDCRCCGARPDLLRPDHVGRPLADHGQKQDAGGRITHKEG